MVPVSSASRAVGTGWSCGHRRVRAWNAVSGYLRSAVWMLLWPREREPEKAEAEEVKGCGDLDMCDGN